MLGLPTQFREDDVAPLGKVLATPEARCARARQGSRDPGFETYVYRCATAPRYRALVLSRLDGDPADADAVGEFHAAPSSSSASSIRALIERVKPDIVIEEMVERTLAGPWRIIRCGADL